ncbi:PP2C family protein-serine/threonine phosphatase [Actibacterium pelagium]|uniref:PP2C family protein-serine/threonine phosphatase n=1 Tax=Actibacterium pelagium TaxID=2029103 RepID=UPI00227A677A|nr:SpoIIE family protein phosphatase [Actibacterium pelagium]
MESVREGFEPSHVASGQGTVLLVDDSRMQRRILHALLAKWGYNVIEAASGHEALDICRNTPVDIVISDWVMPEMDGVEFCRLFRALDRDSYGYFMLLTSKSEVNEMVNGLEVGADEFLTKPVNSSELRARLQAGERVLRMEKELQSKNAILAETLSELQTLYDAIDRDLAQARKIQEALVPQTELNFGPTRVSMLLEPCGHVGGDLIGAFSPGTNRVGFYGLDVSGHGVTSAMMTARLAGYLSGNYPENNLALARSPEELYSLLPPEEVAHRLNERLMHDVGVEEYFTLAYGTIDLMRGDVHLVQAGHPHPLLIRADGSMSFVGDGGPPIGLLSGLEFEAIDLQMQRGERLLFYSDGFVEAVDRQGHMLGEEGLMNLVRQHLCKDGHAFLSSLVEELRRFVPASKFEDDVSALMMEYNGPE